MCVCVCVHFLVQVNNKQKMHSMYIKKIICHINKPIMAYLVKNIDSTVYNNNNIY